MQRHVGHVMPRSKGLQRLHAIEEVRAAADLATVAWATTPADAEGISLREQRRCDSGFLEHPFAGTGNQQCPQPWMARQTGELAAEWRELERG